MGPCTRGSPARTITLSMDCPEGMVPSVPSDCSALFYLGGSQYPFQWSEDLQATQNMVWPWTHKVVVEVWEGMPSLPLCEIEQNQTTQKSLPDLGHHCFNSHNHMI